MALMDRFEDSGILVHGDSSLVPIESQLLASTALLWIPRMRCSMVVSVTQGTLHLHWHLRHKYFKIDIAPDQIITVSAVNEVNSIVIEVTDKSTDQLLIAVETALVTFNHRKTA